MGGTDDRSTGRICIHGHFYQPDRANPWTGTVDPEPTAAPFHDWNQRIAAECYRPNAAARVLSPDGRIDRVVSTYEGISFNVGPTLLAWLAAAEPWTYRAMIAADRASADRFGGHGSAMAQPWVHAIQPLADERDRRTLVRWGCIDFASRFGRPPEGMWLPETAVDTATLEVLAAEGIAFTVLAPWQAAEVRSPGGDWVVASPVDTTRAYRCPLPSGASITAYFYDGALSAGIAFQDWLDDGVGLAERMLAGLHPPDGGPVADGRLVHVATDGESYGHHHRFGDMALASVLEHLEQAHPTGTRLTNYGEHLASFPPDWEARIADDTAWSCSHGIERWRADCGCHIGGAPGWNQAWRAPLRAALDWLRDELAGVFEVHGGQVLDDPWEARDGYAAVLADPSPARQVDFLTAHGGADPHRAFGLLEMQRHLLEAFESSAWFYDDAAGIETVFALRHAARAIELARDTAGVDVEPDFLDRLAAVRSNDPDEGDGRRIWAGHVVSARPARTDTGAAAGPGPVPDTDPAPFAPDLFDPEIERLAQRVVARQLAAVLDAPGDAGRCARFGAVVRAVAAMPDGRWWAETAVVALRDELRGRPDVPPVASEMLWAVAADLGVLVD
jgi:alpha-amylase/alpha-mannosidase (GH57 family)